jgi:oxygen-dependent protoporphyrinogen oxidase
MATQRERRIVVVGGGIAGLACAHRLASQGHAVEVLEAEAVAGGRMRSERHGDFVVDRGAQFIASGYRNLHALATEVELEQRVQPLERTENAMLRAGHLHPGDYDSPLAFLRSGLLSWRAKLRLPALLFDVWRHRELLDPLHPERAAELDRDDLAAYLRCRVGAEAADYLVAPALSATFDSDPEDLSGVFGLLALRFVLAGFRLQAFEGGTGALTARLAERLPVHTGCRVLAVEPEGEGVRLRFRGPQGDTEWHAAAAVIAVPGIRVSSLCPALLSDERAFFERVRYVRGIIVHLMLERPPPTLPYYGVAFPRPEGLDLYGLAVDHHKPGAAPAGAGLVNAALTAAAAARAWDAADDEVADLVLDNLARTPIGRLQPRAAVVHRWDPMLPQFGAGYTRGLAAFLGRSQRSPQIAFAGDYLVGPYTEAALASGLRAAESVSRQVSAA